MIACISKPNNYFGKSRITARVSFLVLILLFAGAHAKDDDFVNWSSYFANVNEELSSIFLDLGLHENAPIEKYPNLSWYWIKMEASKENGLSSQSEYDSLIKHEDALLAFLLDLPVVYAGRITTQGRREFYFYVGDGFDFEKAIQESFASSEIYQYQTGQKSDPTWAHYLNLLYPGENGLKQIEESK